MRTSRWRSINGSGWPSWRCWLLRAPMGSRANGCFTVVARSTFDRRAARSTAPVRRATGVWRRERRRNGRAAPRDEESSMTTCPSSPNAVGGGRISPLRLTCTAGRFRRRSFAGCAGARRWVEQKPQGLARGYSPHSHVSRPRRWTQRLFRRHRVRRAPRRGRSGERTCHGALDAGARGGRSYRGRARACSRACGSGAARVPCGRRRKRQRSRRAPQSEANTHQCSGTGAGDREGAGVRVREVASALLDADADVRPQTTAEMTRNVVAAQAKSRPRRQRAS